MKKMNKRNEGKEEGGITREPVNEGIKKANKRRDRRRRRRRRKRKMRKKRKKNK